MFGCWANNFSLFVTRRTLNFDPTYRLKTKMHEHVEKKNAWKCWKERINHYTYDGGLKCSLCWLWCSGRIWPNVDYFSTYIVVTHAVHMLLPLVLQRLDSHGIEALILILEKVLNCLWPHHRYDTASQPSVVFMLGEQKIIRCCQIRRTWKPSRSGWDAVKKAQDVVKKWQDM